MSYGDRSKFYRSKTWQRCRKGYLASVGGLCEKCLTKGKVTPAVIVHHKEPLGEHFRIEQALSWDNLQALCRDCHAEEHEDIYNGRRKPRRYEILDDGSVLLTDPDSIDPL